MRWTIFLLALVVASPVRPVLAAPEQLVDGVLARVTAQGLRGTDFRVDGSARASAYGANSRSAAVLHLYADRRGMWASSTSRAAARSR